MRHMPILAEVMTPFPQLVDESTLITDAMKLMAEKGYHHLPVVVDHEVIGLLSTADIKLAQMPGHRKTEFTELTVGDICRRRIYLVDLHTRLDEVLDNMVSESWDAAVVLKEGRLAGIFTSHDACRAYSIWLKKEYLPSNDPGAA
ncbi:MAG TPA: CBS domain-containing protein [Oceanospirillales bacterium]|jgi:CBS domain-containing protein|nr:CBS domain-containing protein [Oceanospirillales bacterium]